MSLLRTAIEVSNTLLCRIKRGRRVVPAPHPGDGRVKLNLGCGLAVCEGWLNVDASLNALIAGWPLPLLKIMYRASGANRYYSLAEYTGLLASHRFLHHDLSFNLPFPDNSTDFVYSSHFLEHLFREDARRLLSESLRVLKPGGLCRICVPDLAYAVAQYQAGHKKEMLENYFFVEDRASYLARHKYMYDFELLRDVLLELGFVDVRRCAYREGMTPDIALLDNRPEETVYVEAAKPSP